MEKQYALCLLLCSIMFFVAISTNEDYIKESERYWKKRGDEAMKRNMEAYTRNPFNVTNRFNHRVQM